MGKIVQNVFYNSLYQLMLIILPIVTIPIISRALGPEGIGTFNYTNSITNYFLLIAGFGLANYGVREIAVVRDDKKALSRKFWELEIFNAIIAVFVIVIFIIISIFLENTEYYLIQSLILVGALFDISWFYNGIEDFKSITLSNLLIKILSFVAILVFVQNKNDLMVYILIQSLSILFSQLILWLFLFKKIEITKISINNAFIHFRPALKYLISKMAITLYTNLNKTLLGVMVGASAVGYYSNSYALVFIISSLLGALDMVLLPRMSSMHAQGRKNEMMEVLKITIHLQLFLTIPAMFGILSVNETIVPWFFGSDFDFIKYLIPIFAPVVVIKPLGAAILRQYIMPLNKIREYNLSVFLAALINIVIAIVLIPFIDVFGAVIATLVAEIIVTVIRVKNLLKDTDFNFDRAEIIMYIICGSIMYLIITIVTKDYDANPITTIFQSVIGIIIYLGLTTILKANPLVRLIKYSLKK